MLSNKINIEVPDAELNELINVITDVRLKVNKYMTSLTPKQRKAIPKLSDSNIAFVTKSLDYAESNPEFASKYLNTNALRIDLKAVEDLNKFFRPLEIIYYGLRDAMMLSGSEAYTAALSYYGTVQQAAKDNVLGAEAIYNELKVQFELAMADNDAPPAPPTPPAP